MSLKGHRISVAGNGNIMRKEVLTLVEEHLFERLARERNITVEEMRAIISKRIEKGWSDPNPEKRVRWRKIPCVGDTPAPDEWLCYCVTQLKEDGREDLL